MTGISAKKDRKEDIFKAALKCFNETGYYKTSIDKIAEKAKISKGGIYYHFKSKEELFLKLFEYRCNKYLEHVSNEIQGIEDSEKRLEMFIKEAGRLSSENKEFMRFFIEFMTMGLRDADIRDAMTEYYKNSIKNFKGLIQAGVDSRKFKNTDTEKIARRVYFLSAGIFFTYFTVKADFDLASEHTFEIDQLLKQIRKI
jgi:AcrR family transcriptional regulator